MSWTAAAPARAQPGSTFAAWARRMSRRSRSKTTSSAPDGERRQVAQPERGQLEAEVEDLGAAPPARPFGAVGDVFGGAFEARLGLLLEHLPRRPFGLLPGRRGALEEAPPGSAGELVGEGRGEGRLDLGAQLAADRREQQAGALEVAGGEARGGGDLLRRGARPLLGRGQLRFQDLGRERREVDRLAARGDRLQQPVGLGGEQDQVDEGRRLLERLQQRVLALVAHRLGRLDDEDPVLAFEGPVGGGADHPLAHLVDHVLGAARGEPDEVGVRRGIEHRAAAGVVGIG